MLVSSLKLTTDRKKSKVTLRWHTSGNWLQLKPNSVASSGDLWPHCRGVSEMRRAFFFLSPRQTTDCGKNGGGFSGREPALSHSRLTATERLWLINADVLIDHRQLSPGRRAFSPQQEKKGQINNWGREELLKRPASDGGGRLHIRLPDLFDFVCYFFIYAFIYFPPDFPHQKKSSRGHLQIVFALRKHHHHHTWYYQWK